MKVVFTCLVFFFVLSGCVKLQVLPEDAVKKSIAATKNLYDEAMLKRSGGKKKIYVREFYSPGFSSSEEAENACFLSLKNRMASESTKKEPLILSERVSRRGETSEIFECQYDAYVWL